MDSLQGQQVALAIAKTFEDSAAVEPQRFLEAALAAVTPIGVARSGFPRQAKRGAGLRRDRSGRVPAR